MQKKNNPERQSDVKRARFWTLADFSGTFFLTFGSLAICASLFELAAIELKAQPSGNVILPSTFLEFLVCAFTLCASAFYEECLYRLYLPKAFGVIARAKKNAALFWLAEAAAVLLFAFAHRYQGTLALFNAMAAGIVLRLSYAKSKSVWPPFIAHFAYNAAALFLLGK